MYKVPVVPAPSPLPAPKQNGSVSDRVREEAPTDNHTKPHNNNTPEKLPVKYIFDYCIYYVTSKWFSDIKQ